MNQSLSVPTRRDLRQRMIEDMSVRGFSAKTQHDYQRIVSRFAAFLGRSPDIATAEDVRRFQVEQRAAGMPAPAMNSHVAALRFFFTTTIDRPDLSRKLIRASYPRKLPIVLSPDEVARLLGATTCLKHRAALSVAYGAGLRVAEVAALTRDDVVVTRHGLQPAQTTAPSPRSPTRRARFKPAKTISARCDRLPRVLPRKLSERWAVQIKPGSFERLRNRPPSLA